MAEESFILLNLKEGKAKKLAQVISNETSRKILDFLAKKEATESEIAKELAVPISTIHYSLVHLKEVNLVQCDEFHYSQKGKVVEHYKLSNKMVIIAPSQPSVDSIKEKLMKLFPAVLVSALGAGTIYLMNLFQERAAFTQAPMMAKMAVDSAAGDIVNVAANEGGNAMLYAARAAPVPETFNIFTSIPPFAWFLIGAAVAITSFFVADIVRTKMRQRKNPYDKDKKK